MSEGDAPDSSPAPAGAGEEQRVLATDIGGDPLVIDAAVPDPLHDTLEKLLSRIAGLPEMPMKAALVKRRLEALGPEEAVWCIDQIVRAALWGHQGAAETMMATTWWLIELRRDDDYDLIKSLFEAAHDSGREAVLDLFRDVPPHRALADGQDLPEVRLPTEREITLGERRAMAAGRKRRVLERLLMDPDPLVIRKLLGNPNIRLQDVQVVATRRPTTPAILREVMSNRRWFQRSAAREAVLRNPYAETGLALKLLPTMGIRVLRRLKYSGDLHPLIHEAASRLVTLREEKTAPWRV